MVAKPESPQSHSRGDFFCVLGGSSWQYVARSMVIKAQRINHLQNLGNPQATGLTSIAISNIVIAICNNKEIL
jgi:hypothetical protein